MAPEYFHHLSRSLASRVDWFAPHEHHVDSLAHKGFDFLAHRQQNLRRRDKVADPSIIHIVFDEVEAADELAPYEELRERVPAGVLLKNFPYIGVFHDVEGSVPDHQLVEKLNCPLLVAILRLFRRALQEQNDHRLVHNLVDPFQGIGLNALARYQLQELVLLYKL